MADTIVGRLAVERGIVPQEAVQECLREQQERLARGESVLLADLMRERGLIDDKALEELRREERHRQYLNGAVPRGLAPEVSEALYDTAKLELPRFRRYEIIERLGEGGVAIVYRALDRELHREVALKVLRPRAKSFETMRQRFYRECTAAARLAHPNLVTLHDACEEDGHMYLVMELVKGKTLTELMPQARRALPSMIRLLATVSRAVHYAHQNGIIHRDLKPANIIVTEMGEPKVADFSLAFLQENEARVTETGFVVGTPPYMAPEQVQSGIDQVTARTDVYALGAILYEMLVGRPPHTGAHPIEVFNKILAGPPERPRNLNPRVSVELETVCLKALDPVPSRRYVNAEEFSEELLRYLAGEPVYAQAPGVVRKLSRWFSVRRRVTATAAVLIVAIGASIWSFARAGEAERRLRAEQLVRPIEAVIRGARPWFHVEGDAIFAELARVKKACDELDAIVREGGGAEDSHAWVTLGIGRHMLGDLDAAERALRAAERCSPNDSGAHYHLARLYQERAMDAFVQRMHDTLTPDERVMQHLDTAARHLASATRRPDAAEDADRSLLAVYRALAQLRRDEVVRLSDDAIKTFSGRLGCEEFWLLRGMARGEPDDFGQALKLRPHYARARFLRGNAWIARGRQADAIAEYTATLRLAPRFAPAYNNRGFARAQSGDPKGGIADIEQYMSMRPDDAGALCNRAFAKALSGDLQGAIDDANAAMAKDPKLALAYVNRGNARQSLGEQDAAMADYGEAIRINVHCALAYFNRGALRAARRDLDGALEDFSSAIGIMPANPAPHLKRGETYEARGQWKRALDDYSQAILLNPTDPATHCRRADLKRQRNDPVGAMQDYDRALELNPRFFPARVNRTALKATTRDFPGAMADAEESVRQYPQRPEPYHNRGMVRQATGDFKGAIDDFRTCLDVAPPQWPLREALRAQIDTLLAKQQE